MTSAKHLTQAGTYPKLLGCIVGRIVDGKDHFTSLATSIPKKFGGGLYTDVQPHNRLGFLSHDFDELKVFGNQGHARFGHDVDNVLTGGKDGTEVEFVHFAGFLIDDSDHS